MPRDSRTVCPNNMIKSAWQTRPHLLLNMRTLQGQEASATYHQYSSFIWRNAMDVDVEMPLNAWHLQWRRPSDQRTLELLLPLFSCSFRSPTTIAQTLSASLRACSRLKLPSKDNWLFIEATTFSQYLLVRPPVLSSSRSSCDLSEDLRPSPLSNPACELDHISTLNCLSDCSQGATTLL